MAIKIFAVCEDALTDKICDALNVAKGELKIDTFSDGEFSPQLLEAVRNQRVFLVCSTDSPEKIVKLLLAVDAAKRASASEIVAVIPYFGYSRQDRREGARGAIGAKVMADVFSSVGITRLITADLHAAQIQGFFNIPVDHVGIHKVFSDYLKRLPEGKYCVCSPDAGGVKRAMSLYNKFVESSGYDVTFAMMSKRRDKPNSIESMELIGDVTGRRVILVDDMTDTAGTLLKASEILKERGATEVNALVTHGILSGEAPLKVTFSKTLDSLVISDSMHHSQEIVSSPKIEIVSCAKMFARAISSVAHGDSMEKMLERN